VKTKTETAAGGPRPDSDAEAGARSKSKTDFPPPRVRKQIEFIRALYRFVPPCGMFITKLQYRPNGLGFPERWWVLPLLRDGPYIEERRDPVFYAAAAFRNGPFIAQYSREHFAGGVTLVIDVVTLRCKIDALAPSALVETSPDSFQALYFFDRLLTDQAVLNVLNDAFLPKKLRGQGRGVTRLFRPPSQSCEYPRLAEWEPGRRYAPTEIADAFELMLPRTTEGEVT